jgi:hypothetical protein
MPMWHSSFLFPYLRKSRIIFLRGRFRYKVGSFVRIVTSWQSPQIRWSEYSSSCKRFLLLGGIGLGTWCPIVLELGFSFYSSSYASCVTFGISQERSSCSSCSRMPLRWAWSCLEWSKLQSQFRVKRAHRRYP